MFIPLEKNADFNRRALPLKADSVRKEFSNWGAQTVRGSSFLTGFIV